MLKCQKSKTKAFKHEEKKEYLKSHLTKNKRFQLQQRKIK